MKYLSLFTGIGGFELGINQAYELLYNADRSQNRRSKKNKKGNKGQGFLTKNGQSVNSEERPVSERPPDIFDERPLCIGYSEIDKYASQIYQSHFPNHKNYGDITKIDEKKLPDFDMLVGGFPCQSFSIAGKRGGFADTRGTLFFDITRILKHKQPRLLLLENVKGLLSHDEGRTFATIITTLDELGYDLQWQVLNSKNFGVPQNRERVFIVGHLRGTSRPEVFPFGETNPKALKQIIGGSQGFRVYNPDGVATTQASLAGGLGAKTGLYTIGGLQAHQKPRRDGISPTLTQAMGMGGGQTPFVWSKKIKIRRLTPKECERLQGFPDNWTEGVSDTQRYKCCGNAVTVNVIQAIMEKLI